MITLKRLEANNFKSLRSVALAFPERGSILIEGYNEAGKSTLFEAVYVALYGKPLVGEDASAKRDEVIQHGQARATVQLVFNVGQQALTIFRSFERGKAQQATLTIQRPGMQPETINRVRAVDERILKELGNLDGDSLRNSCFVEQKELGRIEALSLEQRKQAIQKLLGLERLTMLMDQFKFRRERRDELNLAERFLKLAQFQAEACAASAEEAKLAERLDAVKVAIQTTLLADLDIQKEGIEKRLAECAIRVQQTRARLSRCATLKEYLGRCDQANRQLADASNARIEFDRAVQELVRLDTIEKRELPQARTHLNDMSAAAEAVAQTVQTRKRVQETEDAVREAQRRLKELEQAEDAQQQREEELSHAQARVKQRRQEAEVNRQRTLQQASELDARQTQIQQVLHLVKQWEAASEQLRATRQVINGEIEKEQALLKLQMEVQQRETEVQQAEAAEQHAGQEMQRATDSARMASALEALTAWVRLKGVEMALNGYETQRSALLTRHQEAETALGVMRTKTRTPLFVGIALAALTVLTLVMAILWLPALAILVLFLAGSIAAWIWFFRSKKALQLQSTIVAQRSQELQRLDMQRQAAIEAGGDPTAVTQHEQRLQTAGFAVPTTLEAGRSLLQELQQRPGAMQGQHALQETAQIARDTLVRLQEQLKQARFAAEESRRNWNFALQSGNPTELAGRLKAQAAQQEQIVAAAEQQARASIAGVAPWPVTSNAVDTLLATCQAELRAAREAQRQQEGGSERLMQEAESDRMRADEALKQAWDRIATLKASDPTGQVVQTKDKLAEAQKLSRQQEEVTYPLLQKLNLHSEAEVAPEWGRAKERVQILEKQLVARPSREEERTTRKNTLTSLLTAASTALGELLADANRLAIPDLPIFPQLSNAPISLLDQQSLSTAFGQIRQRIVAILTTLDEQGTRRSLDAALDEQGGIKQQRDSAESDMRISRKAIAAIFSSRGIAYSADYTYESVIASWPLTALVSPNDEPLVQEKLERTRHQLFAARQQGQQLTRELQHPGTPLDIIECQQRVDTLVEEREICAWATRLLGETNERIARRVLPITERNMQPLLQQLTGGRYRDVRLTPEDSNGQQEGMDYRIRVWDPAAGRFVAKNIFSGGTRDQCSLALRLAFALATLPQELGVAPGFIFLDEPLSAFDAQRAQALVELLTTGTIAQQFNQVVLISHYHAFDREAFRYHVRMEAGQIVESDLPEGEEDEDGIIRFQVRESAV